MTTATIGGSSSPGPSPKTRRVLARGLPHLMDGQEMLEEDRPGVQHQVAVEESINTRRQNYRVPEFCRSYCCGKLQSMEDCCSGFTPPGHIASARRVWVVREALQCMM
jgi:hypothetical protein